MVKNKKALTLLLVFLTFFNSPAYPKSKSIKYLPSSQDVETVSSTYPNDDYPSGLIKGELGCAACESLSNSAKRCDECVDLKEACPNECFTATIPKAIKCSPEDTTTIDGYNCVPIPFKSDSCALITCDYTDDDDSCTDCGSRERDDDDDESCHNDSYLECNTDGTIREGSPYGLQRRGCPDEYSDELKPNCADCTLSSGIGKDRVWNCQASCGSGLSPSFEDCDKTSGPPRCDGLGSYYNVTYNWAYTTSCTTTQSCNNQCNPTCSPPAPSCSLTSASCSSTSCLATQNCPILCTSPCIPAPCTATATCTTTPYIQSYNYSLDSEFKSCIDTCSAYADDYEECRDRVDCCRQALCAGSHNCCPEDECNKRLAVDSACYNATAGDCAKFHQDTEECLEGGSAACFEEIDSKNRYDFTARTGEAYDVIWQVNTNPLGKARDDENAKFYTMIKVWAPFLNKVVYNSMLHQKNLNAAFSIYGRTLIPKNTLLPGKSYQVQVYYFMNDYDDTEPDYEVKIKDMSLIVIRIRE